MCQNKKIGLFSLYLLEFCCFKALSCNQKIKLINLQDPEKQRKMEEKENKRDKKKNAPKMKQLKVKAM